MSENKIPPTPALVKDLGMIYASDISKQKRRYGIYKCNCGAEFRAMSYHIDGNRIKSCGCFKIATAGIQTITHGMKNHRLYSIWKNMIQRTSNSSNVTFKHYGGRGISVCDRWKDISLFIEDMYPTFSEGLTIDRIDVNGNYELSNCRWTTQSVQTRNTRLIHSTNTSGYRGVSFHSASDKYRARVYVNGREKYLGLFATALDAAKAYDKYVIDNNLEHTKNGVI